MAFTTGNDVNILQGTDAGTVGAGAGNDRYVLDASVLSANQKISISDTQGTNVLQLVGGLQIVSSQVSSNAVLLKLNNGAEVTVLGADTFTFVTAGNAINGTGGVSQNFSEFVTASLGLASVPAPGTAPVSGGAVEVKADGGTTVTPVDPKPPVDPTEPATFTLTTGADSINEGETNKFTITASKAVTADTTVTFKLIAGNNSAANQGTESTNLNDFGASAFNVVTKTIAAGQTSVSFDVAALVDGVTELTETYSVEVKIGDQTFTKTVNLLDGAAGAGQTFMLTKGLDNFPGTAGNDTIIGSVGTGDLNTFSVLDIINGGAGTDTLKVTTEGGTGNDIVVGANVTNVEIVEVSSATTLNVDASAATGVQTLNVIGATGAAAAKAAATTDIAVKLNAATSNAITTQGGKNVSVELSNAAAAADSVIVGQSGVADAAKGDVTVSVTGKAHVAADVTTLGAIAVNGGKTISVTQKATTDGAAAATSKAANSVTQGAVVITADKTTTEVTVKQDATVAGKIAADTTGGVTESVSVKFGTLKAGDSVTVGDLTFTAKVDLTGAEVAAAFANLADAKVPTAGQDTQGSGLATAKGTYSNAFTVASAFTSAAADGDTVVFTSTRANFDQVLLTVTGGTATGSVAPVPTVTQGKAHNATPAGGVLGVAAGKVEITGEAALKTVTIDNFNGASFVNSAAALETLNVANVVGQATAANSTLTVGASAETLGINLNNFGTAAVKETLTTAAVPGVVATVDLNSTTAKTLNVKVEGKSNAVLDIVDANSATALNVSGSQTLAVTEAGTPTVQTLKVTESAGVTLAGAAGSLTSVDTTGSTGTTTVTIDGGKATYAGGAGVDNVTVTGTVLNKSINLGAGNDKLDLSAATSTVLKAISTANLYQGGEGTDTIVLTSANAVELSKDAVFAGKIDGFEKLELSSTALTEAGTVNLANLDNINYVVTNGTSAATVVAKGETQTLALAGGVKAAATEQQTFTLAGFGGTGNLTIGSATVALDGTEASATAVFNKIDAEKASIASNIDTLAFNATTGVITITYLAAASNAAAIATFGSTAGGVTVGGFSDNVRAFVPATGTITVAGVTVNVTAGMSKNALGVAIADALTATPPANVTAASYDTTTGKVTLQYANTGGFIEAEVVDTSTLLVAGTPGVFTEATAYAAGTEGQALTLSNLTSGGTVEFKDTATGAGAIVNVKDAATGTADVLNLVVNATAGVNVGTVKAADVEAINISVANKTTSFSTVYEGGVAVKVADAASSNTITLDANAAKAVTVAGAGKLELKLGVDNAGTWTTLANKVATVDASANTGGLSLDLTAHNGVAVTVTGGAGNDVLKASVGANAKADVLIGGAGNDTLYAGSNGAKLTGGAGNDLFVVAANAATNGTKEINTYTSITDFQAGDVLKLDGLTGTPAQQFAKLAANLNENTSVFANFVDAAIAQAGAHQAVWFQFKGNAYVVVDQDTDSTTTFANGIDTVIELVGVDLANASFNSTNGTVALI